MTQKMNQFIGDDFIDWYTGKTLKSGHFEDYVSLFSE